MISPWNLEINRGDILLYKKMESDNDLRHWRNQLSHSTCDFSFFLWTGTLMNFCWWAFCPAGPAYVPRQPTNLMPQQNVLCLLPGVCRRHTILMRLYLALPLDCISLSQLLSWKEFLFKACSFLAFRQWSSHRLSVIAPPWVSPLRTQKS